MPRFCNTYFSRSKKKKKKRQISFSIKQNVLFKLLTQLLKTLRTEMVISNIAQLTVCNETEQT